MMMSTHGKGRHQSLSSPRTSATQLVLSRRASQTSMRSTVARCSASPGGCVMTVRHSGLLALSSSRPLVTTWTPRLSLSRMKSLLVPRLRFLFSSRPLLRRDATLPSSDSKLVELSLATRSAAMFSASSPLSQLFTKISRATWSSLLPPLRWSLRISKLTNQSTQTTRRWLRVMLLCRSQRL